MSGCTHGFLIKRHPRRLLPSLTAARGLRFSPLQASALRARFFFIFLDSSLNDK
jgi:hypothetical protein